MSSNLCVEVTHVNLNGFSVVEIGAVLNGRQIWRLPVAAVVAMYRAGARFFIKLSNGKAVEIYPDDRMPGSDISLRTSADKIVAPALRSLPQFPN
ncbi:hypothetical protein QFZ83_003688 [Variovorax sp. W1I1]|nr:hypothetical protein [Variovorax sp. W1I1]